MTDACPSCGGDAGDNWFDRSICPCDDTMHTRCVKCGHALDGCKFEQATGTRVTHYRVVLEIPADDTTMGNDVPIRDRGRLGIIKAACEFGDVADFQEITRE